MAELAPALASSTEPRLTWYGPDDERIDLSGRVLANWFVKAANFCAQELELEPGDRVWLDLPTHWRALVWAVGAWTCGAQVVLAGSDSDPGPDVVVTATPDERTAGCPERVVITLPALAMRLAGGLPDGAIDGAADLPSQPDQLIIPGAGGPDDPALGSATQADLLTAPAAAGRVLAESPAPADLLTRAPALWAVGGSIVLVTDPAADPAAIARTERATPWAPAAGTTP